MVGQNKLIKLIDSYSLENLPNVMLFIGEKGCGKKTIIDRLLTRVDLPLTVIQKNITADQLLDYTQSPIKRAYLINLDDFSEQQQNQFLKFIEEPTSTTYIILTACAERNILYTIRNRCYKLFFEPYTLEQLKSIKYYEDELVYQICTTPGQLLAFDYNRLPELYDLCLKIVEHVKDASYANTVSLITRLNLKDEYDKFDSLQFCRTLASVAFKDFVQSNNKASLCIYSYATQAVKNLVSNRFNKENLMLSFLTNLWKGTHGYGIT